MAYHGREQCLHGKVAAQCRCMHGSQTVTIVSCEVAQCDRGFEQFTITELFDMFNDPDNHGAVLGILMHEIEKREGLVP